MRRPLARHPPTLACEQGLVVAQGRLARMYEHGHGIARDPLEAWVSHRLAYGGDGAADAQLELLARELAPEQLEQAEARVQEPRRSQPEERASWRRSAGVRSGRTMQT